MTQNNDLNSAETNAEEIRALYAADPSRAETLIATFLEQELQQHSIPEKLDIMDRLIRKFEAPLHTPEPDVSLHQEERQIERPAPAARPEAGLHQEELSKVLSMLIGRDVSTEKLDSDELLGQLSLHMNTIFDMLNQITGVIHSTLLGESAEPETIRHIIGSGLEGRKGTESLESYLNEIREAFLRSHRAFQQASDTMLKQVLNELDPDHISSESSHGLKFGPFRKAESFEIYSEKYDTCKRWYASGRFKEELLREFEKICQKLYKMESGRV